MEIFDPQAVRRHRARAAAGIGKHDFLLREVADRLVERLGDMRREFGHGLALDDHGGVLTAALEGRVGTLMLGEPDGAKDESFDLIASLLSLHWVNDLPGAPP